MPRRVATIVCLCAALAALVRPAWAQSPFRDDFEGPQTSLHDAGGDASYRIESHARVPHGAHRGQWCEQLTVRGNNGTYVYLARPVPPARIISELAPSLWLKADRPGLQILARVTLPRSADPESGKPLTTLLRGSAYSQVGVWQQLRFGDLPQALERQVRVLRAQFGRDVDAREAYIDRILINGYGGPGATSMLVDDLEMAGIVSPQSTEPAAVVPAAATESNPAPRDLPPTWAGGSGPPTIERSGSLLMVGGKPFFPRMIEYQGESLARIKALGFNTVWLARGPSEAFLREAASMGLWVVAPPPPLNALSPDPARGEATRIDSRFDAVLAWDLGRGLATRQLEATRDWARLVQSADPRRRPIVCEADSDLTAYTRPPIHVLLARRDVLGTSLQLGQYTTWLRSRAQLALPGTILWAAIQTEPSGQLVEQLSLLAGGRTPAIALQESQIRTLVHAALAAGARGLCFQSHTSLDANDPQTRRRAAMLELVNLELELVERWPSTGSFTTTADSSDQNVVGAVVETDRSRLLLPMYTPPNSQLVMGTATAELLSYTVPGVPEEDNAYELSPVNFRPVPSKRVAGGTQVLLGELERDSLVVFTSDQVVIRGLAARQRDTRRRAAELARAIATADLVTVEVGQQRLAALGHAIPATRPLRLVAQNDMRQSESAFSKGDHPAAYYHARHALAMFRAIERAHFEEATSGAAWPLCDPWAASFATLPEHFRFVNELSGASRGANLLREGECENLQRMMSAGWKHFRHPQANITTAVDLSPQVAHSGGAGLRLRAVASDENSLPGAVETPPMWVTTSAVPVERGQLLEIRVWLRIPRPIIGSVDGLLVIDSLTGEPLAQRVTEGDQWQQLTAWRAVGQSGAMTLTFALSGLGEAWIDDVSVAVVHRGAAAQPQQARQMPQPVFGGGS